MTDTPSLSDLLGQVSALLGKRDLERAQFANWFGGSPTGGPTNNGLYPLTDSTGFTITVPSPATVTAEVYGHRTPQQHGAKGDGVTDDTVAINTAIATAAANGEGAVYFPVTANGYMVSSPGVIENNESRNRGMIKLKSGVSLLSDGAKIILSGGRMDPPGLFYQAYWIDDHISDLVIEGFHFYGNGDTQLYVEKDSNGNFNSQYSHAIAIMRGENVVIRKNKFENWFGDGCETGNVFQPTDIWTCFNFHIYDNEFKDIVREGVMFTSALGCSAHHNWFHGNGFLVAGIDIERHSSGETIRDVHVHNNLFDFRDGVGPGHWERAVPNIHYRRAVSLGFFYSGYTNNTVDGGFENIIVENNMIYQGCMDVWRPCNVRVIGNTFINFYEDLTGVGLVNLDAIRLSDPGFTTGLKNVEIASNTIRHPLAGHGIWAYNYSDLRIYSNDIQGTMTSGIQLDYCSGFVKDNKIEDCGTSTLNTTTNVTTYARASGIVLNGGQGNLVAAGNEVKDTRLTDARLTSYAVELDGTFYLVPMVIDNTGRNMHDGVVLTQSGQADYALVHGNTDCNSIGWSVARNVTIGDGTGTRLLEMNSATGNQNSINFRNNGIVRSSIGADETGIGLAIFDANGAYLFNGIKAYSNGRLVAEAGQVAVSGTWQKPFTFNEFCHQWVHLATNTLYFKIGSLPISDDDGSPVGINSCPGTWDHPYILAGYVRVWADPGTAKIYTNYQAPTGPTDGTILGAQS